MSQDASLERQGVLVISTLLDYVQTLRDDVVAWRSGLVVLLDVIERGREMDAKPARS